jgi:hypothetical protein
MSKKLIITEEERNDIKTLYNINEQFDMEAIIQGLLKKLDNKFKSTIDDLTFSGLESVFFADTERIDLIKRKCRTNTRYISPDNILIEPSESNIFHSLSDAKKNIYKLNYSLFRKRKYSLQFN